MTLDRLQKGERVGTPEGWRGTVVGYDEKNGFYYLDLDPGHGPGFLREELFSLDDELADLTLPPFPPSEGTR